MFARVHGVTRWEILYFVALRRQELFAFRCRKKAVEFNVLVGILPYCYTTIVTTTTTSNATTTTTNNNKDNTCE